MIAATGWGVGQRVLIPQIFSKVYISLTFVFTVTMIKEKKKMVEMNFMSHWN